MNVENSYMVPLYQEGIAALLCIKGKGKWVCEICKATFDRCMYLHIIEQSGEIIVLPIGRSNVMIRTYA